MPSGSGYNGKKKKAKKKMNNPTTPDGKRFATSGTSGTRSGLAGQHKPATGSKDPKYT